jgi:glutathione S-transferase
MAKYLLVSFTTCPWVQRAAIVLREKKIDFEYYYIDTDNWPDWLLPISPHKKVPVLCIDEQISLFESNAIVEYLDETIWPRLHPEDVVQRAINRAWTDYLPAFAEAIMALGHADRESSFYRLTAKIPSVFEPLDRALAKREGPFFNGSDYSLVDASYAPFLQRYVFIDRIKPVGVIDEFPRLKAWCDVLLARSTTHSFPEVEFERLYLTSLKRRQKWLSQFIPDNAGVRQSPSISD